MVASINCDKVRKYSIALRKIKSLIQEQLAEILSVTSKSIIDGKMVIQCQTITCFLYGKLLCS